MNTQNATKKPNLHHYSYFYQPCGKIEQYATTSHTLSSRTRKADRLVRTKKQGGVEEWHSSISPKSRKIPQLVGPALDAATRAVRDLRERAMRELNLTKDNVVIRSVLPDDVGRTGNDTKNWRWILANTGTSANTVLDNVTISDNRFVSINGFALDDGAATDDRVNQIEFVRKGSEARRWNLLNHRWTFYHGTVYSAVQDDQTCWVDDPKGISESWYPGSHARSKHNFDRAHLLSRGGFGCGWVFGSSSREKSCSVFVRRHLLNEFQRAFAQPISLTA